MVKVKNRLLRILVLVLAFLTASVMTFGLVFVLYIVGSAIKSFMPEGHPTDLFAILVDGITLLLILFGFAVFVSVFYLGARNLYKKLTPPEQDNS